MSFLITCPICGPRPSYEFRYGGEDKGPRPDEEGMTAQSWVEAMHLNRCMHRWRGHGMVVPSRRMCRVAHHPA